jgi:hypothetical protein
MATPFEGLELFRRTVLSQFVYDIKYTNQERGFREECAHVTQALASVTAALHELPSGLGRCRGKVIGDAQYFFAAYGDWNDGEGETDSARQLRVRKALRLQKRRERFSKAVRRGREQLSEDGVVSWKIVRSMSSAMRQVVAMYPSLFPKTDAELTKFERLFSPHW